MVIARFFLVSIFIFSLNACTNTKPSQTVALSIEVSEPDRMRFHGKGAGAGMMLMSSMGPMGIAVGVAIDEGIGKDIDESAREAGFSVQDILQTAINQQAQRKPNLDPAPLTLRVDRYGFVTRAGEGDPVVPQLHLTHISASGKETSYHYPEMFSDNELPTISLDTAKSSGEEVIKVYEGAVREVVERLMVDVGN